MPRVSQNHDGSAPVRHFPVEIQDADTVEENTRARKGWAPYFLPRPYY